MVVILTLTMGTRLTVCLNQMLWGGVMVQWVGHLPRMPQIQVPSPALIGSWEHRQERGP